MKKHLYIFFLLTQTSGLICAQDSTLQIDPDIFSYSIEEILDTKVTGASKNKEFSSQAPAIIYPYTEKDIQKTGYYTLRDLANITPGYSSFRGIGEITFETRGQKADGFDNNKHLVLIDGIPFSHQRANKANAEEGLPLLFAERVEFMKGPSSALYGISAFYGVINIASKDIESYGTTGDSKVSIGTPDFQRRYMGNITHKNINSTTKLAFSLFKKDASRSPLGNGKTINQNSLNYDDRNATFLYVSHKVDKGKFNGISGGIIYSEKSGGLGDFWMMQQNQTYEINNIQWEQITPFVKYEKHLKHNWKTYSYIKGNISTEKAIVGGFQTTFTNGNDPIASNYNIRVYDLEVLSEVSKSFKKGNIIFGINLDSRHNPGGPESYAYTFNTSPGLSYSPVTQFYNRSSTYNTYSLFSQLKKEYKILHKLEITAGIRGDFGQVINSNKKKTTNAYNHFSPRLALVQHFNKNIFLKCVYNRALRSPLIKEIGLNEETATNNPSDANSINNLEPETHSSLDFSIGYLNRTISTEITTFFNRTENSIGRETLNNTNDQININTNGVIKGQGIEAFIKIIPVNHLELTGNIAYAETTYPSSQIESSNVPTWKINLIGSYKIPQLLNLQTTLIHKRITQYRTGSVTENRYLPGHSTIDWNNIITLSKQLNIEFQVLNLLNTTYRTPAFYASGEHNILGEKRTFIGTVSLKI